ncbi:MAG TPA: efflux RND transporter periplasmic adaptor subunit [Acidiphilium sp.]|nr:MAG: efflux transporter periplasmic adaptor subunit [Acidiphilium sp. 21-60-14]OYV92033.1 MAG: efflux transporter periplasmic adaptor subunit [Acidiphilium sp. 37-60-79]OZB39333.1 MAG: efflux transporter periplasmic adaptor subunit [Acidiphilium sp. 34-60-192]HQT89157.1 efflux RND transporter periplasmic adaptor subunit [Acidiphilium sp.]HQU24202.1 efflux RND transporter periplasmic adaptor subunit [Acidiphilium sp.]
MRRSLLDPALRQGLARNVALCSVLAVGSIAVAAAAMKPPTVSVVTVKKQKVYQQQSFIGRIQATRIVNLVPRITGYLEQRLFHQGADVKKGQLLYVIEPGPYQAAFDQANAAVSAAKATLANAQTTLGRSVALLHTPAGQRSTLDNDRATEQSDAANLDAAKAQRETAAINLSYTQIRSPINGRIGPTNINIGNVVSPTTGTLATVVSQNPVNVTFSMPARDALKLRQEYANQGGLDAVELRLRLPDRRMDKQVGTLDFTSNQISQNTDSLAMQGTIANPQIKGLGQAKVNDRELTSGEFVTVVVRSKHPVEQIVLPRDAVLSDQLGDYVLTVDKNNKVVRTSVKLGQTTPATATIANGLALGSRVIVDGIEKVHPGLTVKPETVKSETSTSGTASPPSAPG